MTALQITRAYKKAGGNQILDNFSMTVPQGSIYSLLGASGCGKTTVLQCGLGLRCIDRGEITVLGGVPGSRESGVPGNRVGYMPQEMSLYGEFSIKESLVYGMSRTNVAENMDFLIKLLDLPQQNRRIHTLSIWTHLGKMVSTGQTTVIITTHYIEESRNSHTVGLMRNGRLLTEKCPTALLLEYQTNLLEDIVLKLCLKDNMVNSTSAAPNEILNVPKRDGMESAEDPPQLIIKSSSKCLSSLFDNDDKCLGLNYARSDESFKLGHSSFSSSKPIANKAIQNDHMVTWIGFMGRLMALTTKNYLMLTRNIGFLLFIFFVPAFQIVIICLAIGNDPKHIKIGVVNHEVGSGPCEVETECGNGNLSCKYLDFLPKDSITQITYKTEEDAVQQIQRGNLWGYLSFPKNYSAFIMDRALTGNFASNETLFGSRITFNLDMSNKQIGQTLKKVFFDAFQKYIAHLLQECGYDPAEGEVPLHFNKPIYGTEDTSFREFIAPSVLLGLLFFFPLCSSGISYITERKTGTLERSLVAGTTTAEVMFSFLLTHVIVLVGQSAFAFIIMTLVFGISIHGSLALAMTLSVLVGIAGMSMGFLISTFCMEEIQAVLLAIGSFFPNFLLAGMVWPIQGMHLTLQYLSYLLPCTLACESMRSIVSRGWGVTHSSVWPGFVSTLVWILVYWSAAIVVHRFVSKRKWG